MDASAMTKTIVNRLGLNSLALASVLRVSRPTLYNWLKGGDVKGESDLWRLETIYEIAKRLSSFNSVVFGAQTKIHKFDDGRTYVERLSDDDPDIELVEAHARIMHAQECVRRAASLAAKGRPNDIDRITGGVTIRE